MAGTPTPSHDRPSERACPTHGRGPVSTLVAEMNTFTLDFRTRSKSTSWTTRSLSGLALSGLKSYGLATRVTRSNITNSGEVSRFHPPSSASMGDRRSGLSRASVSTPCPEAAQGRPRLLTVAIGKPRRQRHRIHRPGRRARYALDLDARIFQQTVEHAPRERPVRAATLQGKVDHLRLCRACPGHRALQYRLERRRAPRRQ